MRILYVISNPFYYTVSPIGGSISSGTGVIKSLDKKGYKIDILSDDKLPTIKGSESINYIFFKNLLIRKLLFENKKLIPFRIYNFLSNSLFKLSIRLTMSALVRKQKYDLVYIRASHFAYLPLYYAKNSNLKSILEVNKPLSMQSFNRKGGFSNLKRDSVKKISSEIKQYEYSDLISIDSKLRSKWILKFVDKKFKNKILINHNGVDQDLFFPSESSIRSNIVGMASSFRWYNDIDELMNIIHRVINRKKEVIFKLFIGDKSKKIEIDSKIESYGLKDSIVSEYEIPLNKMPEKISECNILISHFNFHGVWPHICSIKHLEYMALSKPVVATNAGEVNFAIKHDHNGILVDEGDEDGFANAIIKLLDNKKFATKLGINGRKDVIDNHTWDRHVDKFMDSYKKL